MTLALYYTCPKRKCRHTWSRNNRAVLNDECPSCGTKDISPVDIERSAA